MDLRANTAVDVLIGPFIDITDGNTTEDGLTLTAAEIKLSKNGQALTLKNDATAAAFDDDGYYNCELDATDTDTEGNLVLIVHQAANALPVRHEYNVLSEAAWDSLYAAKDTGFMDVNIKAISEDETAADNAESFFDGTGYAGTNNVIPLVTVTTTNTDLVSAASIADAVWDEILTGASHNTATSAGRRLRQLEQAFIFAEGVIATQTDAHTCTLDTGALATADYYIGARLQLEEGTGAGQSRLIHTYSVGRVCVLDSDWITNPDTSTRYSIVAADVHVSLSDSDLATGFVAVYTNTTTITLDSSQAVATTDYYKGDMIVFTHGTGAGQSREITGYTSGRVVTMSPALTVALDTTTVFHIVASVSIPEIVAEIWDEAMVETTGAPAITGSMREFMQWWAALSRNTVLQTATTTTLRNDADGADLSTSAVSDNGTTFTRGEFST